jgi:hypothetical protein
MIEAWAAAPVGHQLAVLAAMTQVGVPYRRNTSQENVGFDCSGITTFAWARAGVELVRQSSAQIQNAARIDRSEAKAGDLVQYPGHVMMYLGVGDAVIHSVMTGRTVELDTISERRTNSVRFGDPSRATDRVPLGLTATGAVHVRSASSGSSLALPSPADRRPRFVPVAMSQVPRMWSLRSSVWVRVRLR